MQLEKLFMMPLAAPSSSRRPSAKICCILRVFSSAMGQNTSSHKGNSMKQPKNYIVSEDRKSILKRTKAGSYEVAASFPEPLTQDFGLVDMEEEGETYPFPLEKNVFSTDPSFLDLDNQKPADNEPEEMEEPSVKKLKQKGSRASHEKPLPPSPLSSTVSTESSLFTPPSSRKAEGRYLPAAMVSPILYGTPQSIAYGTPPQVSSMGTVMTPYESRMPSSLHPHLLGYVYSPSFGCSPQIMGPLFPSPPIVPAVVPLRLPRFVESQHRRVVNSSYVGGELLADPPKPPPRNSSILQSERERGTLPKVLRKVHHVTLYDTMRKNLAKDRIPERMSNRAVDPEQLLKVE